ncbi:MAG: biotin/lipoate A/B protein ligase family protein [Calditrichia bacterium]
MKQIRLLDLGNVSPLRSQTCYHAVAYAMKPDSPDTVILVNPARPYVCIGFHQDLEKEVDLDYCRESGFPVYRREVGGGAVYLDNNQVFVQWIFHPGSLPADLETRFRLYVKPLVETYRALDIPAYLRPVNDIHVDGKKIGGTGAAQIGEAEVLVGSLMFDFDKSKMARVLKVPSEKMRDKIFESLEQYMTTIKDQLGKIPDREKVKRLYAEKMAKTLNAEVIPGTWSEEEETMVQRIDKRFLSDEWLYRKGTLKQSGIKIHEDVKLLDSVYKAPGGLIRATVRLHDNRIDDVALSGDFTLLPGMALGGMEQALRGISMESETVREKIVESYHALRIQSPGVTPEDFSKAVMLAIEQEQGR